MKPKNLVFCNAIDRSKMLFETEKKANNFLRYNSEEILEETGKAPVRSYYCAFCGGWHVTSNPSKEVGEHIDRDIRGKIETITVLREQAKDARNKQLEPEEERIKNLIYGRIEKFNLLLLLGKWEEAEDQLDNCEFDIADLEQKGYRHDIADRRLLGGRVCLQTYKYVKGLSEEDRRNILQLVYPTKDQKRIMTALKNFIIIEQLTAVVENQEEIILCDNKDVVSDIIVNSEEKVSKISGEGARAAKKYYNDILLNIVDQRKSKENDQQTNADYIEDKIAPKIKTNQIPQKTIRQNKSPKSQSKNRPQLSNEDSQELVYLIDRIMKVRNLIETGDYQTANEELEICVFLLAQMGKETEETKFVKCQLNQIRSALPQ